MLQEPLNRFVMKQRSPARAMDSKIPICAPQSFVQNEIPSVQLKNMKKEKQKYKSVSGSFPTGDCWFPSNQNRIERRDEIRQA
jgi:hypothetical protein